MQSHDLPLQSCDLPLWSCDLFELGLPNEQGRVEILDIHTSLMRKHKKLGPDVNTEELAKRTQNFSGAELEGLVRSAQATAMNKLIKVQWDPTFPPKLIG